MLTWRRISTGYEDASGRFWVYRHCYRELGESTMRTLWMLEDDDADAGEFAMLHEAKTEAERRYANPEPRITR